MKRAIAEKWHMGLTTWEADPAEKIVKADVSIAKNCLNGKEILLRFVGIGINATRHTECCVKLERREK